MKICPVCSREYPDDVRFCSDDGTTLRAAAPSASLVGQVIADRYHVLKKLGEGGMGQVYLAEHVRMGRRSAIKVMNPGMVHDPESVARFNREAQNASRITHHNVCAVYDFGETPDGLIYLAMEFVEGQSLTSLLEHEGALPLPRATAILKQTADALQAAHDLGIVHRDLKPDNVMLARGRDGTDVVKVVDFGIAKAFAGDQAGQKVTKTGFVTGTPEFMSPEQLSGDTPDGRSDLYSLALVYFRMLTGQLPFAADTAQEVMMKRLTDEPATLAGARPDLAFPDGLQAVLDTALARVPRDRYQTVGKFAEDVLGVVQLVRTSRGVVPATRAAVDQQTQIVDSHETHARATLPATGPKRSLVPFAIGAVVVLGLGGGAWAVFGRGGAAAPDDSTVNQAADTTPRGVDSSKLAVTPPAAGTTRTVTPPHANSNPTRTQTGGGGTTADNPPPVDSAAVDRDLGDILELVLDPQTLAAGRQRATTIYENDRVPATLRAQAAFMVSQTFFQARRLDQACLWNSRALQLKPLNESYLQFKRDQGCEP